MKFGPVLTIAAMLAFPVIAREKTALRITGSIEEITQHGALLVDVRVLHQYRKKVPSHKRFTGMKSRTRSRFAVRTRSRFAVKEVPLLDSWCRVFLLGKGSWYYDGQVWSGLVYEHGTYQWRGESLICFKPYPK